MRWLGFRHQHPLPAVASVEKPNSQLARSDHSHIFRRRRSVDGTPTLILSQARFRKVNGKTVPDPATLEILTPSTNGWRSELVTDDEAAVFHKAMIWKDGILSISGGIPKSEQQAYLKHWTKTANGWSAQTLWAGSWTGDKQRLRDFEFGDVDGDGHDELIIATHDQGVVVVLDGLVQGGPIVATELDPKPNTYVHEVEIGDIDGDGNLEFFATPSDPNKRTHTQAGDVVMYRFQQDQYVRTLVDRTKQTHAKEILAADIDGDGTSELFSAVEAEKREGKIVGQVEIRQFQSGQWHAHWSPRRGHAGRRSIALYGRS